MATTVSIYVEDITTVMLSYTSIRLYSGTDPSATFSNLVTTITLVAGTEQYSYTDSSGTISTLYRAKYYNTNTAAASSFGDILPSNAFTLRALRLEAAREAYGGFSGTCSGTGTTTTLIDVTLTDTGKDAYFQEGSFLYRPDAAATGDKLRRVTEGGFSTSTGALTVRTYTNAPASAEEYHIYNFFPPVDMAGVSYSWDRAIRDGLRDCWYMDQVNLGEGTSTGQTRFSLQQFGDLITRDSIYSVMYRTTDSNSIITDALLRNSQWSVQENDTDGLTLLLQSPPTTNDTIIIEVKRRYALPFIDTDAITGPRELAIAATCRQLFWKLGGQKDSRYLEWQSRYRAAYRVYGAMPRVLV